LTDAVLVLRKLARLRDHLARLGRRRQGTREEFLSDVDRQDAVALSLMVAIQEALDVALHIASDEGWGLPATYAEGLELLAGHGVVDPALGERLRAMVALRNRIAHGYASVEMERIWDELPEGLAQLAAFSTAVARFADPDAS
jgi:uncharacterized protein YutE (UPF0331/DUF86 family)